MKLNLEGSFGTQKEPCDLRRVKARTKLTEILYIFFGIHTEHVVQMADSEDRNGWDQSAASVKLKTLNDSPYNRLI